MAASLDAYLAQDSLSCGICFEKYNTSHHMPKVLPCQHTFCGTCVDGLTTIGQAHFECPVCRRKVMPSEVTTNLGLRDVVEELHSKTNKKMCCPKHDGKECHMVCIDCCQPLCTKCMKELKTSPHMNHDIDDIEEAMEDMKKSLTIAIDEKIADLEKTSAAKLDCLMEMSTQHAQDVDAVVAMVISALSTWKENQLQNHQSKVQKAINKQTNPSKSLKFSWENKRKMSNFRDIIDARKDIETASAETEGIDVNMSLNQENINLLRDNLVSVCDKIQTSSEDGVLQQTLQNLKLTAVHQKVFAEVENLVSDASLMKASPHTTQDVLKLCVASQTEDQNIPRVTTPHIASPTTSSSNVCPKCNADIPLCLKRRANLYNFRRNKKFHCVVHDRRRGHDKLICRTDDFIFLAELDDSKRSPMDIVDGLWTTESQEDIVRLETWNDVLYDRDYSKEVAYAKRRWKETLQDLRSGKTKLNCW